MSDGTYQFARNDSCFFLKLSGALKYTGSAGFDLFLETFSDYFDGRDVLIDLCDAEFLDSTNLGLLARIADRMLRVYDKKTTIVSTNPEITLLLDNMGFSDFFIMVAHPENPVEDLEEIPTLGEKERSMTRMMLDAHRSLIAVNDKNKETFCNVVDLLEQQIKEKES